MIAHSDSLSALTRFVAVRDRLSRLVQSSSTSEAAEIGRSLESIVRAVEEVADAVGATRATSFDGYEIGTKVEVYDSDNGTWKPGVVERHSDGLVSQRLTAGVAVSDPSARYPGLIWWRHIDGNEIRRAA